MPRLLFTPLLRWMLSGKSMKNVASAECWPLWYTFPWWWKLVTQFTYSFLPASNMLYSYFSRFTLRPSKTYYGFSLCANNFFLISISSRATNTSPRKLLRYHLRRHFEFSKGFCVFHPEGLDTLGNLLRVLSEDASGTFSFWGTLRSLIKARCGNL